MFSAIQNVQLCSCTAAIHPQQLRWTEGQWASSDPMIVSPHYVEATEKLRHSQLNPQQRSGIYKVSHSGNHFGLFCYGHLQWCLITQNKSGIYFMASYFESPKPKKKKRNACGYKEVQNNLQVFCGKQCTFHTTAFWCKVYRERVVLDACAFSALSHSRVRE